MNNAQARRMAFTEHGEGTEIFRGKGLKKQRWYSICSAHGNYNKDCNMCRTGSWENMRKLAIGGWFHDHIYWLWYFWVNYI
jgi:hypothetical protein